MNEQYIRRFRQHIPFYKSLGPFTDRRVNWYHNRHLCDTGCIFGIPVLRGQHLMFVVEDPDWTALDIDFRPGQGSVIQLCCLDEDDSVDCGDIQIDTTPGEFFFHHEVCFIDGEPIQFNYFRIKLPTQAIPCGLRYFKIIAYEGTSNERYFYSQPVQVFDDRKRLLKLNIHDTCSVGGVQWAKVMQQWQFIDGYEVYLPDLVEAAYVDDVTDEEFEEDGRGNEVQIYESTSIRYQFDTGLVPEHFKEIITEITKTNDNSIVFRDNNNDPVVKLSRAEATITIDGDGCLMNANVQFQIHKYDRDSCCDVTDCDCPQDSAKTVISYIIDEIVAEDGATPGDCYLVPNNGAAGPNPEWKSHDNEIATWNGTGWDYEVPNIGDLVFVDDVGKYYISRGPGDFWAEDFCQIVSITDQAGPTCTWTVIAAIPQFSLAKLQFRTSVPVGAWVDSIPSAGGSSLGYLDQDAWASGQDHFTQLPNTYDLRLVFLDTGCSLTCDDFGTYLQTESC